MYVLALDTATNSGGVAISRNQELIGQIVLKTPLRYSETLIPMVDFLLHHLEINLSEIGLLAVAAGPGSFTGLRVGLATAKAIGQAIDIPAIGVSTLEALACRFRFSEHPIVPMMDARRQQVYAALYQWSAQGSCRLLEDPVAQRPDQWLSGLDSSREYLFVGDGARQYRTTITATLPGATVIESDNQVLESLCLLGFQKLAAGEASPVDQLKAIYVRPADVRR